MKKLLFLALLSLVMLSCKQEIKKDLSIMEIRDTLRNSKRQLTVGEQVFISLIENPKQWKDNEKIQHGYEVSLKGPKNIYAFMWDNRGRQDVFLSIPDINYKVDKKEKSILLKALKSYEKPKLDTRTKDLGILD